MKVARLLRKSLFPFSYVYGSVMAVRNFLFRFKILKSHSFDVPVICVGNLSVGGTGKTPHIEYLVDLIQQHKKVAVLSRGYKRKTTGFRIVNKHDTGLEAGDEPLQIKQKFPSILVAVDEKRVHGIHQLLESNNPPEIILLDDAFQHRWVKPGLQILLDNFNDPIHEDIVLPAGNLREFSCGKKRADIVIVTKCDGITHFETEIFKKEYEQTHSNALFFSHFIYENPEQVFEKCSTHLDFNKLKTAHVLLVTGIAKPEPFLQFIGNKCSHVKHLPFPDHHGFSESDIDNLRFQFNSIKSENKFLLFTEKDAVRLRVHSQLEESLVNHCFYIPIKINILFGKDKEFKNKLLNYVQQF